jgi:hypothetical protein
MFLVKGRRGILMEIVGIRDLPCLAMDHEAWVRPREALLTLGVKRCM